MSAIKLGVVMDALTTVQLHHDSSIAMLLEAQRRQWQCYYMQPGDLFVREGVVSGAMQTIYVEENASTPFVLGEKVEQELQQLDIILMRKDPPFDAQYLYATHLLELAEKAGVLVVNKPSSLRDFNEKLFIAWFPQCCAPTLITQQAEQVQVFLREQQDIVCKPLHGRGGESVFRLQINDPNINVILETLTQQGRQYMLAQRYIPQINESGDKRILLIDGVPIEYALARFPKRGETRANLAVGGSSKSVPLTARDRWICEQVAPVLSEKGLLFVGIDVIGDYLTEINVTSPTCIRELDAACNLNIAGQLLDCLMAKL